MSRVNPITLLEPEEKTIAKGGNSRIIYLPKETKSYFRVGDKYNIQVLVEGNQLQIILSKPLYKFGLNDIKNLADKYHFKIEYDKNIGDVIVFESVKSNFTLSYTQDRHEGILPASVTLATKFDDLDYRTYEQLTSLTKKFKKKFHVITRPEGDLDTINVLKDPDHYNLNTKKAFELLKQTKKWAYQLLCNLIIKRIT